MVTGLDFKRTVKKLIICESCVLKTQKIILYKAYIHPGKAPIDLIYSDIAGPFNVISYNKARYFVIFLDDYIKILEIYTMKYKSEVFGCFVRY